MDLYVEVIVESAGRLGQSTVISQWFDYWISELFTQREDNADVRWSAGVTRTADERMVHFADRAEERQAFMAELRHAPFWAEASLTNDDEEQLTRIRTFPSIFDDPRYLSLSATVPCTELEAQDEEFCSEIGLRVVEACAHLNPAFGRVEHGLFHDRTNLDIGLRRRPMVSIRESRSTLRGYAWVTVLPEELLRRIGGTTALKESGAFFRVCPLPAGGAVLQASPTVTGFTDSVLERVFGVLSCLLPRGVPSSHVAFPGVRFIPQDAEMAGF